MAERARDLVRFAVRLTPRGGADRVEMVTDGVLHVRVVAAPVDGAANRALVALIATELRVARGTVRIASGMTGRRKVVEIVEPGVRSLVEEHWPGLVT